jgi:hypothetical protein
VIVDDWEPDVAVTFAAAVLLEYGLVVAMKVQFTSSYENQMIIIPLGKFGTAYPAWTLQKRALSMAKNVLGFISKLRSNDRFKHNSNVMSHSSTS